MITKTLIGAAAAGLLAFSIHAAQAATMQTAPSGVIAPQSGVELVHGFHQDCRKGPGGWHRHNKWGQRRACKPWRGHGKRPDACIKVGPLWYCDY